MCRELFLAYADACGPLSITSTGDITQSLCRHYSSWRRDHGQTIPTVLTLWDGGGVQMLQKSLHSVIDSPCDLGIIVPHFELLDSFTTFRKSFGIDQKRMRELRNKLLEVTKQVTISESVVSFVLIDANASCVNVDKLYEGLYTWIKDNDDVILQAQHPHPPCELVASSKHIFLVILTSQPELHSLLRIKFLASVHSKVLQRKINISLVDSRANAMEILHGLIDYLIKQRTTIPHLVSVTRADKIGVLSDKDLDLLKASQNNRLRCLASILQFIPESIKWEVDFGDVERPSGGRGSAIVTWIRILRQIPGVGNSMAVDLAKRFPGPELLKIEAVRYAEEERNERQRVEQLGQIREEEITNWTPNSGTPKPRPLTAKDKEIMTTDPIMDALSSHRTNRPLYRRWVFVLIRLRQIFHPDIRGFDVVHHT